MAKEVKGDLRVKRTLDADRRVNEGLIQPAALDAERILDLHSHKWQRLTTDDLGEQTVTLPDATTLSEGWMVIIQNFGSTDSLNVKDDQAGALKTVAVGKAYSFTCVDNSDAAGEWYVNFLEDDLSLVATRYTSTFDAGASWGAAAGGYYTITVTNASHSRGADPIVQIFETSGGNDLIVDVDQLSINASGDAAFRTTEDPDLRFAGKIVLV